jgi:hypothetical protein
MSAGLYAGGVMRAVIPFETEAKSSSLDEILAECDWMIDDPPSEPDARREFWRKEINKVRPEEVVDRHEAAFADEIALERDQLAVLFVGSGGTPDRQPRATGAEEPLIGAERAFRTRLRERPSDNGHGSSADNDTESSVDNSTGLLTDSDETLISLAADEAREILFHVAPADQQLARINFQYPIFDRHTQTFGSVHYEPDKHNTIIRLKNTQSEKLKIATERLVADLLRGKVESRRSVRAMNVLKAFGASFFTVWFRSPHRHRRLIAFSRIRVLEPRKSVEAFSGIVVAERSLGSVLRERRVDTILAAVFLTLGVTILILSSPEVLNLDFRMHSETWINGWLAWGSGNMSRIGSAFFVAVFLPIIQIVLHWRAVRRKSCVSWIIDVAKL